MSKSQKFRNVATQSHGRLRRRRHRVDRPVAGALSGDPRHRRAGRTRPPARRGGRRTRHGDHPDHAAHASSLRHRRHRHRTASARRRTRATSDGTGAAPRRGHSTRLVDRQVRQHRCHRLPDRSYSQPNAQPAAPGHEHGARRPAPPSPRRRRRGTTRRPRPAGPGPTVGPKASAATGPSAPRNAASSTTRCRRGCAAAANRQGLGKFARGHVRTHPWDARRRRDTDGHHRRGGSAEPQTPPHRGRAQPERGAGGHDQGCAQRCVQRNLQAARDPRRDQATPSHQRRRTSEGANLLAAH